MGEPRSKTIEFNEGDWPECDAVCDETRGEDTRINLAVANRLSPLKKLIERSKADPGAPFEDSVLQAAAALPPSQFMRLRAELKGVDGIGITSWDEFVDRARKSLRSVQNAQLLFASGKSCVECGPDIDRVVDEIDAAMIEAGTLFQRGGVLVEPRVARDRGPEGFALPKDALRTRLSRAIDFVEYGDAGPMSVKVPEDALRSYHAHGVWGLPELVGFVDGATIRPDGSILNRAGYDDATGYYCVNGIDLDVPDRPTQGDALNACYKLRELLVDFPFVAEADEAAAIALLLQLVIRGQIDGCVPFIVITANQPGSGKGLLRDVIFTVATGRPAPAPSAPQSNEEFDKRLTALCVAGSSVFVMDNVRGRLGGQVLEAAVTAHWHEGRVLGVSQMYKGPLRLSLVATSNNAQLTPDMVRRTLPIRLETNMSNPEGRTNFKIPDILSHAKQHRAEYLGAALTILRAYRMADGVQLVPPWGSFEAWNAAVRAPLVWCGAADPLMTREGISERDNETAALAAFLVALRQSERAWRPGEIAELMNGEPEPAQDDRDAPAGTIEGRRRVARDIASAARELIRKSTAQGVSAAFECYRDRPVDVDGGLLELVREKNSHTKRYEWRVREVGQ